MRKQLLKIHFLLALLITCLLIMSCGQKGDLVRPQEGAKTQSLKNPQGNPLR